VLGSSSTVDPAHGRAKSDGTTTPRRALISGRDADRREQTQLQLPQEQKSMYADRPFRHTTASERSGQPLGDRAKYRDQGEAGVMCRYQRAPKFATSAHLAIAALATSLGGSDRRPHRRDRVVAEGAARPGASQSGKQSFARCALSAPSRAEARRDRMPAVSRTEVSALREVHTASSRAGGF
jgi:hypothetical protein